MKCKDIIAVKIALKLTDSTMMKMVLPMKNFQVSKTNLLFELLKVSLKQEEKKKAI